MRVTAPGVNTKRRDGKPRIGIECEAWKQGRQYLPEQISAMVLGKMNSIDRNKEGILLVTCRDYQGEREFSFGGFGRGLH